MKNIAEQIAEQIVPLSALALCAFIVWGLGYLVVTDIEHSAVLKSECIAAGKQIIVGNCVE